MCNIFSLQRNVTRTTLRRQFIFKELTGVRKLFWDSILTMWGCLSLRKNVQEPVLHRTSPNSHALENTLCMCRKKKLKERKERKRKKWILKKETNEKKWRLGCRESKPCHSCGWEWELAPPLWVRKSKVMEKLWKLPGHPVQGRASPDGSTLAHVVLKWAC